MYCKPTGLVTDSMGGNLQTGLSFGIIFPLILCAGLALFMIINRKNKKSALDVTLSETPCESEENSDDSKQS